MPAKARIYVDGKLVQTVVGARNETMAELRKRINITVAVDGDTPKCPRCLTNTNVVNGFDSWLCPPCGTSFIPSSSTNYRV